MAFLSAHCSRGCAFGDFDNDVDVDILIVNLNESPALLRNDMKQKQNWIKVKLEGVKSNRNAIGARVVAHYGGKAQAQAVLSQSSFTRAAFPACILGWVDSVRWISTSTGPTACTNNTRRSPPTNSSRCAKYREFCSNKGWART